ncbi:hypothetical protein TR80_002985 [Xanthomonas campestris]|uniref:hypothetical protein n=2 Tax=Xanthomonas TaxID=338 RepID=UPI0011BEFDF7|nr:hypothetical protein [Xanthomonas sp. 3058]MBB5866584.1 hypothetical protein [Xanthomonas sp. 3058]TXD45358.1 hypothetical protein TR80_002985 [Xanthomonas campestris]
MIDMGVDLKNKAGTEFHFSTIGWSFYLNLASVYGWKPEGTSPPIDWIDREPWGAHYDWNAGQSVADSDARELAAALGRYVADPHGSERALSIAKKFEEAGISVTAPSSDDEFIGDFIDFARSGTFEIW